MRRWSALTVALVAVLPAGPGAGAPPLPAGPGPVHQTLVQTGAYTATVDHLTGCPWSVRYTLRASDLTGEPRYSGRFRVEPQVPERWQVRHDDYTSSGQDRGHMMPAADRPGDAVTFRLSNVCPMSPRLNRGRWASLERHVRELAVERGELVVTTGPIWGRGSRRSFRVIGDRVWVPSHFFKVAVDRRTDDSWAWVYRNGVNLRGLEYHSRAVEEVEQMVGADLWP